MFCPCRNTPSPASPELPRKRGSGVRKQWDMPLPHSRGSCPEGTEGVVFIWTHFGGNLVSPKWIMKDRARHLGRQVSVFFENGSLATQQSCALDDPEVARTILLVVWWAGRNTKTRLDKKPRNGSRNTCSALLSHPVLPAEARDNLPLTGPFYTLYIPWWGLAARGAGPWPCWRGLRRG